MDLTHLLFSFKGRIRRLQWWVASIVVGLIAGAATTILEMVATSSGHSVINPETHQFEPTGLYGLAVLAVGLANTWINFALSVKRLHDRDRTGWWLVVQVLVLVIAVVFIVVAIAIPRDQAPTWYVIAGAAGAVAFGISLWLLVEIGFLKGTVGPNRVGPDPLGTPRADATL